MSTHGTWEGLLAPAEGGGDSQLPWGWAVEDGGAAGSSSEAGMLLLKVMAKRIWEGFLWQRNIEFIMLWGKT